MLELLLKYQSNDRCFIDLKAVYDSVDRSLISKKLQHLLDSVYFRVIPKPFLINIVQVSIDNFTGTPVLLKLCLTQGSVFAPILYDIFINDLVKKIRDMKDLPAAEVYYYKIPIVTIQYADDIALVAMNTEQIQSMIMICEEDSRANGYSYSVTK